jgi:hypothetical protein
VTALAVSGKSASAIRLLSPACASRFWCAVSVVRPGIATWPGPRSGVSLVSAASHSVSVAFAWSSVPPVSAVAAISAGIAVPTPSVTSM